VGLLISRIEPGVLDALDAALDKVPEPAPDASPEEWNGYADALADEVIATLPEKPKEKR
jgi:hypothetical protein